jgi:hypothetical protein
LWCFRDTAGSQTLKAAMGLEITGSYCLVYDVDSELQTQLQQIFREYYYERNIGRIV